MSVTTKQDIYNYLSEKGINFTVKDSEQIQKNEALFEIQEPILKVTVNLAVIQVKIRFQPSLMIPIDKISIRHLQNIQKYSEYNKGQKLKDLIVFTEEDFDSIIKALSQILNVDIRVLKKTQQEDDFELLHALHDEVELLKKRLLAYLVVAIDISDVIAMTETIVQDLKSFSLEDQIRKIRSSGIQIDRLTKQLTIKSVIHPQNNYRRIQQVRQLLIDGKKGIEIRDDLNFTSEFNLYKTFKKYTQMTMGEFMSVVRIVTAWIDSISLFLDVDEAVMESIDLRSMSLKKN